MADKTKKRKKKKKKAAVNKYVTISAAVLVLLVLFFAVFFLTYSLYKNANEPKTDYENETLSERYTQPETQAQSQQQVTTTEVLTEAKTQEQTTQQKNTVKETTTVPVVQTTVSSYTIPDAITVSYPSDDESWLLICLNRYRCVDSSVESKISLSYVAGSSERMDSRAAAAYENMYAAAAEDGIYLTPCSGYRSYSRQKTLYYEFVNDYLNSGYSEEEAHNLASKRRNPPGSSEHNIGICMDIICAASSANFQNTDAYAWLCENAQDYGFILRYPEDKVSITGVKFEPWHWRYVGVSNAIAIKNSGLCLEEYLGLA